MKRAIILDTSSYEEMLASFSQEELKLLSERNRYAVEGFVIIRKELRAVPKHEKIRVNEEKLVKLRIALLSLYDFLTQGRSYALDDKIIDTAYEYFNAYFEAGGSKGWKGVENDFEIVACASHKQVNLVVSEDRKTMFSKEALKAYEKVNSAKNLRMPEFLSVGDLRNELRGVRSD